MDISSLIAIVIAIVAIYFFIKLVLSPIIKAVLGVIIFLSALYLLQRFFGFDIDKILAPFGISLNLKGWGFNLDWLLGPAGYFIDKTKDIFGYALQNIPKNK